MYDDTISRSVTAFERLLLSDSIIIPFEEY